MSVLFGLDKRIAGFRGNSTLIVLVPRHHDVAFHSPACSPGIFDQPVVLAIIGSVSNDKNTMIELRAAAGSVTRTKIINILRLVTQILYLLVKWDCFLGSRFEIAPKFIWSEAWFKSSLDLYDPLSLEVIADYQEKRYPGCNLSCVFDRSRQPSDMQSRKNTENLTDELSSRTTFNSFRKSPAKHREN